MRRDHDLVRGEDPERIVDRLERIAVANLASSGDSESSELGQRGLEALRGSCDAAVHIREPPSKPARERGTHDEYLGFELTDAVVTGLEQRTTTNGLVGYDENLP